MKLVMSFLLLKCHSVLKPTGWQLPGDLSPSMFTFAVQFMCNHRRKWMQFRGRLLEMNLMRSSRETVMLHESRALLV